MGQLHYYSSPSEFWEDFKNENAMIECTTPDQLALVRSIIAAHRDIHGADDVFSEAKWNSYGERLGSYPFLGKKEMSPSGGYITLYAGTAFRSIITFQDFIALVEAETQPILEMNGDLTDLFG